MYKTKIRHLPYSLLAFLKQSKLECLQVLTTNWLRKLVQIIAFYKYYGVGDVPISPFYERTCNERATILKLPQSSCMKFKTGKGQDNRPALYCRLFISSPASLDNKEWRHYFTSIHAGPVFCLVKVKFSNSKPMFAVSLLHFFHYKQKHCLAF